MVGMTGLEPATLRPPAVRATRLRHIPANKWHIKPRLTDARYFLAFMQGGRHRLRFHRTIFPTPYHMMLGKSYAPDNIRGFFIITPRQKLTQRYSQKNLWLPS